MPSMDFIQPDSWIEQNEYAVESWTTALEREHMEGTAKHKKIIIALDDIGSINRRLNDTAENPDVAGYKLGCIPALQMGIYDAVDLARSYMKPGQLLVYDHQKAGNDIPHISAELAKMVQKIEMGFDKLILFPIAGDMPVLEEVVATGMPLIVGFHLSHLNSTLNSGSIVIKAAELGIRDFVIPWEYRDHYADWFRFIGEPINRWYVGIGTQTPMPEVIPTDDYLIVGRSYKEILQKATANS